MQITSTSAAIRRTGSGLRGRFGGLYSWHEINFERSIAFGAFGDKVKGNYNARSGQMFGEIDYPFKLARAEIAPFVNLTYARWDANGWSESGGDAALHVQAPQLDGLITTAASCLPTTAHGWPSHMLVTTL